MPRTAAILLTIAALAATSLGGCGGSQPSAPAGGTSNAGGSSAKSNGVLPAKLRLLVVGDSAMAQRISRLRGEWSARTGGSLEVSEMSPADLAHAKSLAVDLLVYPCSDVGTLAERRLIRPMQTTWLDASDYHKADLFELPGLHETAWGEQIYAVPLGSPVLVCFYRADLFEKLGRKPPRTWAEYQRLVEFFDRQKSKSPQPIGRMESGTLEPLAAGWAGNVLLARAAAYAKHRDYYSTLFDKDSLEPGIATEPFVRALTELVAVAKLGPKSQLDDTPADVRREFFAGRAAMALSWPTATDRITPSSESTTAKSDTASPTGPAEAPAISIGFCELPGSPDVFNPRERQWVRRKPDDEPQVPLLGIAGRMGSVVRGTPSANAAFELLVWLSGNEWSAQVSTVSPATTLFRRSQMANVDQWVEPGMPQPAAKQYAAVASQSFSRSNWLFSPRLPGHEEYMAGLDDAVRRAVAGNVTSAAALAEVAARWQSITDRRGRAEQRRAYVHSLGLEE